MTLFRFLTAALIFFAIGIGLLYAGVNREPFRHAPAATEHKHSLDLIYGTERLG